MPGKGLLSKFRKLLPGKGKTAHNKGNPTKEEVTIPGEYAPQLASIAETPGSSNNSDYEEICVPPSSSCGRRYIEVPQPISSSYDPHYEDIPRAISSSYDPFYKQPPEPPPMRFLSVQCISTWAKYYLRHQKRLEKWARNAVSSPYPIDPVLADKISIWKGVITILNADIIVNETQRSILGDRLYAKYIISTPQHSKDYTDEDVRLYCLRRLNMMIDLRQRTIAFPCSTSTVYGMSINSVEIVLKTIRNFLEDFKHSVDRIVLCVDTDKQLELHELIMIKYFPLA